MILYPLITKHAYEVSRPKLNFCSKLKTTEFNLLYSIPIGEACKTLPDKGAYLIGAIVHVVLNKWLKF